MKTLKKTKLTQGIPEATDSKVFELEPEIQQRQTERKRGPSSSLQPIIPGLVEFNSIEDLKEEKHSIHTLFLPFSCETDRLSSTKNLVNYSNIIILINLDNFSGYRIY